MVRVPIGFAPWGLACCLWFAAGCAHGDDPLLRAPLLTSQDPRAEQEIRDAKRAAEEGRLDEAAARYEQFLRVRASDPLAAIAKFELGRIRLRQGQSAAAEPLFEQVSKHPEPALAERGKVYLGIALQRNGKLQEAIDIIRPLLGRTVDAEGSLMMMDALADAYAQLGDHLQAVIILDARIRGTTSDTEKVPLVVRATRMVEQEATPAEILKAFDQLPRDGAIWSLVVKRAVRVSFAAGELDRVVAMVAAMREQNVPLDPELQTIAIRSERSSKVDPTAIGVILPLTGRAQEAGALTLRGMLLATGEPSVEPGRENRPHLVLRDDGDDPERAVRAVEDLVSLHRVIAIVGPLGTTASQRAARKANELGVPLITLAPGERVSQTGSWIFRLFPSPRGEVRELLSGVSSARRVAAIYPDSGYGRGMVDALKQEAASRQIAIAETVPYPTGTTSFASFIETLLKARPFDTLFVFDSYTAISMIVPTLAASGVWSQGAEGAPPTSTKVAFVFPSVGFHPDLVRTSGRYLQGAIFSQPFYGPGAASESSHFVERFEARYGVPPQAFAAYGYDSCRFVLEAIREGAQSRADLETKLRSLRLSEPIAPAQGFGETREPLKNTRLWRLQGATLVEFSPHP